MTFAPYSLDTLPRMLPWVTSACMENPQTVAFRSGAGMMVLDQMVGDHTYCVPTKLLANRMALTTATMASKLESR